MSQSQFVGRHGQPPFTVSNSATLSSRTFLAPSASSVSSRVVSIILLTPHCAPRGAAINRDELEMEANENQACAKIDAHLGQLPPQGQSSPGGKVVPPLTLSSSSAVRWRIALPGSRSAPDFLIIRRSHFCDPDTALPRYNHNTTTTPISMVRRFQRLDIMLHSSQFTTNILAKLRDNGVADCPRSATTRSASARAADLSTKSWQ